MEDALKELIAALKEGTVVDDAWLSKLLRRHNRATHDPLRRVAKRRLLPYYLSIRANDRERWQSWEVDEACEAALLKVLRMKPRRTASGVATVSVLTKPWPCSSACLYCPNDIRMPKSYLTDEPACQRAERNFFDPYLQVRSRLVALSEMGHVTDKVELIVLGGTWNDYPASYQTWFMTELFRAVNDFGDPCPHGMGAEQRDALYRSHGFAYDPEELTSRTRELQDQVNRGDCSYNEAIGTLLRRGEWEWANSWQSADIGELIREQHRNEKADRRVVGLTIETRPDLIDEPRARHMRLLGCTKVQMGIQSLNDDILAANHRNATVDDIARAFSVLRLAGFKIQVHLMCNLLGATSESDRREFETLVTDMRFQPDEIKLYPCSLVESARLSSNYRDGTWQPYDEETLVSLLADDVLATPAFTRISRMIRDISSSDIVAGNKKTNLRQMVEGRLAPRASEVREIRMREIACDDVDTSTLVLDRVTYQTSVSREHFLQWITPLRRICAFLRLSLPHDTKRAMIREVHVYGRVAALHLTERGGAQHTGLGRALIEEAARIAHEAGYESLRVISSVGTRPYYRGLGFVDDDLYQSKALI